jgi:GT2 family glycosyltransferase
MSVAAVVPHWNRRELLETLLKSVQDQTQPFDEVVVVDNGSADDSVEVAERAGARVIRLGVNLGFAAAVNRGVAAAKSDWVAILNNDVTLKPDWLSILLTAAEREGAFFAAGKLLRADNPAMIDGSFDEISRGACANRCGAGKPDSPLWNRARRIRFAPMTAALFRRDLFDEIGPLDERFGSYLEDVDFGLRCALSDRGGIYEPRAVAMHRGSATLGAWNSDTVRCIARNQVLLVAKHFRGQPQWPIVAGQLLWGLVALRHAKGFAFLRGKLSGLQVARSIRGGDDICADRSRLRAIVQASERDIFELEQQAGFDRYWRVYFWLLRR